MCNSNVSARQLARWMVAYCECANSEMFDDLVSRPTRLDVPLICMRFSTQDETEDGREEFDLALPGSATIGEIREALDSLEDGDSPKEHMASCLARRYEEDGALEHIGQESMAAQLFHANVPYRAIALVWGQRWICTLPLKYSISSDGARLKLDEDLTLRDFVNQMLEKRVIRSSRFTMPHEAIEDEYRSMCEEE